MEIKFRAWIIDEKKMLQNNEWFVLDITFPTPYIQYADQGYYTNNFNCGPEQRESLRKNNIEPVDQFVLMQCTGLKDKDGVEYYHKDIFIVNGIKYIVECNFGGFGFYDENQKWTWLYKAHSFGKIVGNTFENKINLAK